MAIFAWWLGFATDDICVYVFGGLPWSDFGAFSRSRSLRLSAATSGGWFLLYPFFQSPPSPGDPAPAQPAN